MAIASPLLTITLLSFTECEMKDYYSGKHFTSSLVRRIWANVRGHVANIKKVNQKSLKYDFVIDNFCREPDRE